MMGSLLNPFKQLPKSSYLQLYLPLLPFYKHEVVRMSIVLALDVWITVLQRGVHIST